MLVGAHVLKAIDDAAREHGIDVALLRAVAYVESRFNPMAKSDKGAMGLVQLMPDTARELGVTDPFDPVQNARGGAKYLKRLIGRYGGDVGTALAAYNWGMGNVANSAGKWPAQVQGYVSKVLARRAAEARELGLPPPLPEAPAPLALPPAALRCSHCGHAADGAELMRRVAQLLTDGAQALEQRKGGG